MTRNILITGCSSGIGLDCARAFREAGWRVFASCRKEADCAARRDEGFEAPRIDYEDPDSIASGAAEVLEATGGRIDVLFHNGAYAIPGPVEDIPTQAMRTIFEANFIGWHDLTRHLLPAMRAAGQGRILLNSSVLGIVGMRWRGAYVATKFALEGWADVLRMEMAEAGIDVVLIEPGPIETEFRNNAVAEFEKWVDWEASPRADQYRSELLDKLRKGGSGGPQWPASAVTKVVLRAATAKRPRARYGVTPPTHVMAAMRRLLPTRLLDAVLKRG